MALQHQLAHLGGVVGLQRSGSNPNIMPKVSAISNASAI